MATRRNPSLVARTLRLAVARIGFVSICAGAVSYFVNHASLEEGVRRQLALSTEQSLLHESMPFKEIKDFQRNFLDDFRTLYADVGIRRQLVRDFDWIFYRHDDGSYTQRPGLFEGDPLPDGRRFPNMSATYAPDIAPDDDVKVRFALSYILSHKYGSSAKGRLFNLYGVVPEKGFPIHQTVDIAKAFTYVGPDALKLETYEFYYRGFGQRTEGTIFTRMYFDYSNNVWMTTVATRDVADPDGKHKVLACVDVLLDELMARTARPAIEGAHSTLFQADEDGTLIYHPNYADEIKRSGGAASIRSLGLESDYAMLEAGRKAPPGKAVLLTTDTEIVAVGRIPETPWVLTVHYPRALLRPAILQNLAIVIALGFVTLLVEIFIIRSILQEQVAARLNRLMEAMRQIGVSRRRLIGNPLPTDEQDEIGELAREFAGMADRVHEAQEHLEEKVRERTAALEDANLKLTEMSTTDELTGVANRRRFDEVLSAEWKRATRSRKPLALALVDVDWFKRYNDHHGHQAGDECLRQVAAILKANAQRAGDLVTRYGGEEFAIILPDTSAENGLELARRLCQAVGAAMLPHGQSPTGYVSISVGVAGVVPSNETALEDLFKDADLALYRAKNSGRNRAVSSSVEPPLETA